MSVICGIHKMPHPTAADVRACYARRAADETASYGRQLRSHERRPVETSARSVDAFDRYDTLIAEREAAQERAAYADKVALWYDNGSEGPTSTGIDPVFAQTKAGRSRLREAARRQGERLRTFQAAKAAPARTPVKSDGVFRLGDDFFQVKVAVHGSGRLYANRFDPATRSWEYAPGAMRRLAEEDRLTIEEAGKFGKLYGECINCHRTLTKQESIDAGIGPICAGKADYFA